MNRFPGNSWPIGKLGTIAAACLGLCGLLASCSGSNSVSLADLSITDLEAELEAVGLVTEEEHVAQEASIQECMAEQGIEYTPAPYEPDLPDDTLEVDLWLDSLEIREEYDVVDPDMSDSDFKVAEAALWGDSSIELTAEEKVSAGDVTIEAYGCTGLATFEANGGEEGHNRIVAMSAALSDVFAEVAARTRFENLNIALANCLEDSSFDELGEKLAEGALSFQEDPTTFADELADEYRTAEVERNEAEESCEQEVDFDATVEELKAEAWEQLRNEDY